MNTRKNIGERRDFAQRLEQFVKASENGDFHFRLEEEGLSAAEADTVRRLNDIVANYHAAAEAELARKREKLTLRNRLLGAQNKMATLFLSHKNEPFESMMAAGLHPLADAVDLDGISVWKNFDGPEGLGTSQIYRWGRAANGTTDPIPDLQDLVYAKAAPGWAELLGGGGSINCPVSDLPANAPETAFLKRFGVVSVFVAPVFIDTAFWGFGMFLDRRQKRYFNNDSAEAMRSAAHLCASTVIRGEIERKIIENNDHIRILFDNAPVGLTLFDENFKFVDCNDAVLKIYDTTREYYKDFFGSPDHSPEFQPDGMRSKDKALEVIRRIIDGETMRIEWIHRKPNGELLPVELTMIRMMRGDKFIGLGYIYDMREQIRLKNEIHKALLKTQDASRAKSEFLSNMSHEMRTPLNAIIGMTSIGRKAADIEGKDRSLDKIKDASSHLLGVINDVLDMAKIEADRLDLSPIEYNFEKMLQRAIMVVTFRVDEKRLRLTVNVDSNIPRFIVGDDQRLSQVITNLLSNAVKFTPEGGEIRLDARLVCENSGGCELMITVADNGIGISAEQQARLFRAFEQAESGTSREYGGTGLGLVISKRIIELMGGTIRVESEIGKGAKFTFTVKAQRSDKSPRSLLAPEVNWKNIRILAVDDMAETRNQFRNIFAQLDILCDVAADGFEACRLIEKNGAYDIYFVDWRMPGMDGIELTRRIKAMNGNKPSVVTMITAADWDSIKDEAMKSGVDKYLLKPLFSSMIIDCVNECLGAPQESDEDTSYKTGEWSGKRLLLAEDVEINREILLTLLEDTGLAIDCAENGKQAIDMVEADPAKYDMIFMDVQMPQMDGLEATRRIRAMPNCGAGDLPIIAMTANVFKSDIEACMDAGMDDHLGKPLDIEKVIEKLRQYLSADR